MLGSQPSESPQRADPQPLLVQVSPLALQDSWLGALQDSFLPHHPLFVGFIAFKMGCALQEDILRHCEPMAAKGREILRHGAGRPPVSA